MKRQLTKLRNQGYRVIYLDETMFTRKTVKQEEWCKPKENFRIEETRLNEPALAMLSGIGKENGLEHFKIYNFSVNTERFIEWLKELRVKTGDDKVALFMDNLSAHKAEKSIEEMKQLGFRWIWNCTYSPQYNPIELVFSKVKNAFKNLRAQKLIGNRQESHEAMVAMAMRSVRKQDIVNCIRHVEDLLK